VPQIGQMLGDRYRLTELLGEGGMATIYLGRDLKLDRDVAVKLLRSEYGRDEAFVARFRQEAYSAASLSHPNVVQVYDYGTDEAGPFIVMEYVDGQDLGEILRDRGFVPSAAAARIAMQVADGLAAAHAMGIVHRDVKPSNILVSVAGQVKVADFGIARAGSSQMTEAGSIIGTAQYLSPEQARGAPVDESSDLYSTGILLFELLTGQVPFTGETPVEIAMKHLSQVPPAPSSIRSEIPHDLDLVVLRALAKEPADRYRSAKEMDRDLELVGRGDAVGPETEEAATMVLRGESTAETSVQAGPAGYGGDERYRAYEGQVKTGRAWWPWLVAAAAAIALGIGGWLLYDNIRDQIDANEPVAVNIYTGILEQKAVALIDADGFEHNVRRLPNADVQPGYVYQQDPEPGTKQPRGSIVTILVSSGKPKVTVPSLVGKSRDAAVAELTRLQLEPNVVQVSSSQQANQVTAQNPKPGVVVVAGSSVRINVSSGPKPVAVPSVIGQSYDSAAAQLQSAGFTIGRVDVDSDRPAGQVVDQSPPGNSTASKGSSVTLSVSKGPTTVTVPDVSLQTGPDARATLRAAGFKVAVVRQDTDDESLDGLVMSQDPAGNTQADPKSVVTLTVGQFVPPPDVTTDTTTTDTTTTDTTTTDTTTTDTTTTDTTATPGGAPPPVP
jgi:serine/threonine-protein kinase